VYVICTEWPSDGVVLNIKPAGSLKAVMPGTGKTVQVKSQGSKVILSPPALTPDDYQPAYVIKVSGLIK